MRLQNKKRVNMDDMWRQIKRTVNGIPVSQKDIDIILSAIRKGLAFELTDKLLDIGCGNGALAQYLFDEIDSYLGIDISKEFIKVAKSNFQITPSHIFKVSDAAEYVETAPQTDSFTKVLCYGAFMYMSYDEAQRVLAGINTRFKNVTSFYIGNIPDSDKAKLFFRKGIKHDLHDHKSALGIWRTEKEFNSLAEKTGWKAEFFTMPKNYYASHFRYDVRLKR